MYKELQKEVYNWLVEKNKEDKNFTFSVRQKANKGAELNYFIGTEKSKYFSTTFWTIPVSYPGSSTDLINLVFSISKNNLIEFHFQFYQTKNPSDNQNKYALQLIRNIKPFFKEIFPDGFFPDESNKMEFFAAYSKPIYHNFDELKNNLEKFINKIIPVVNEEIKKIKLVYPDFYAERMSIEDHKKMIKKMNERFDKYNIINEFTDDLVDEENDLIDIDFGKINSAPLNQILYGPPGTGKTYNTINKAIAIANPEFDLTQNRNIVKSEYERLVNEDQIVFTTFHQSMTYEDFIEGIKPVIEENEDGAKSVVYEVKNGVFKKIIGQSKQLEHINRNDIDWDNADYYKMSLGGKNNPHEHEYCISNNLAGISWGGNEDLTELLKITNWKSYRNSFSFQFQKIVEESKFNIQASFSLGKMKIGDIVVATKGNHIIDAIGKVTGGYTFDDENPTTLLHFRNVEWFAKNLNASPDRFLKKNISQQSIYQFYNSDIKIEAFKELTSISKPEQKNYVLIIDEINRGNVSQIFGELITLIEEDKRLGNEEEIEVTLPYSKEKFGVPSNLYIIGTMNTADRSVESLDTALRRRFVFEEMPPKYDIEGMQQDLFGYSASDILKTINKRIEKLLDRDHQIGHAYFINKNESTFINSFYKNIIPLLQEYFFGDYGKIGLILGGGFIRKIELDSIFANFDHLDYSQFEEKESYEIINHRNDSIGFSEAIQLLMNR